MENPSGFSMLYLDAQSDPLVFWRKDVADVRDIDRFGRDNELCLDGLTRTEVNDHFGTLGRFRLLATAQYKMKNNDVLLRQCLIPKASLLGDDGLMEIALKNYVHTLARDGKKIKLRVRTYDRVKLKQHEYEDLDIEPKLCRNDGRDAAECDAAIKRFARSSDDYWYPCCRSLETIDCVAKLKMDGQSKVVGLIQITKSDKYTIDSKAINKYAGFFPNGCRYIALVPNKETCDKFRLAPASPDTNVPLDVAYIKEFPQSSAGVLGLTGL